MAKTKEEILKIRSKELAIIKAQNEMLENAKQDLIERGDVDESIIEQINNAQEENFMLARNQHGASVEEVNNSRYHGASVAEIKKYEERLKRKGLTDDQLHQKNIDIARTSGTKKSKTTKTEKRTEVGVGKDEDTETTTKTRRTRRKKQAVEEEAKANTETIEKIEELNNKKVEVVDEEAVEVKTEENKQSTEFVDMKVEDFNLADIPSYIQYDMIPLPSNGECYSHKKSRIPVAYLTAADENIITSPNMYRDGKILDVILRRKILDKSINVDELCSGDRDAIILWLRATAYGDDFPIVVTHPDTGKQYNISVKLSQFKYEDFKLKGDENGWFDFTATNGDVIKFKYLTKSNEEMLRTKLAEEMSNTTAVDIVKSAKGIKELYNTLKLDSDEERKMIEEDIDEIIEIVGARMDYKEDNVTPAIITEQMVLYTQSVNGNTDREYIRGYVENMRAMDAYRYRNFFTSNRPGVDFNLTVDVPESDGGGSFDTFLRLDDTVFLNI